MTRGKLSDIHQHVLWGVDDGPHQEQAMLDMLEQNAQEGVSLVFATSHSDPQLHPLDLTLYRKRLKEANAYCKQKQLNLRVVPGCEIFYRPSIADLLPEGKLLPLGDSRFVLVEFGENVTIQQLQDAADKLYRGGYSPIFAHVERYRCLKRSPKKAIQLREDYGITFQMNCHTITHPHGFMEQLFVYRMLKAHAIDVMATDAHDTVHRPVCMQAAYQAVANLCSERYARELTRFGQKLIKE